MKLFGKTKKLREKTLKSLQKMLVLFSSLKVQMMVFYWWGAFVFGTYPGVIAYVSNWEPGGLIFGKCLKQFSETALLEGFRLKFSK